MDKKVALNLYKGIINHCWIDIHYLNVNSETNNKEITHFEISILDIDVKTNKIQVDLHNYFKFGTKNEPITSWISLDKIIEATIIEQSYYDVPNALLDKLENDSKIKNLLKVIEFDNNILSYYAECHKYDNDPYIKKGIMINGIDNETLFKEGKYLLDNEQFEKFMTLLFSNDVYSSENKLNYVTIAINDFSIYINGKQYNVAYREIHLNFKEKSLIIKKEIMFNKSFMFDDDSKISLHRYVDIDPDEFCNKYIHHQRQCLEYIKENFFYGERIDTTPTLFLLERKPSNGVFEALNAINELDNENKLTQPLKSLFGRNRAKTGTNKDFNIIIYDKNKVNIDQMRVITSTMSNHTTYVKGPPGTGKTETIFNVLLSAYFNNKTVLVCSNNNHPLEDIYKKIKVPLFAKLENKNNLETLAFPALRLGNREKVLPLTLISIEKAFALAKRNEAVKFDEINIDSQIKQLSSKYKKLKSLIRNYENRLEIEENIYKLKQILKLTSSSLIQEKTKEQLKLEQEKYDSIKFISDEEVTSLTISAKENDEFLNYLYYSTLSRIKKLNSPRFDDLRKIIKIPEMENKINKFVSYIKEDNNLKKLLEVFPIIVTTNASSSILGTAKKQNFDLCVMDESGQCNITQALISIIRCDNLLLIGDPNQLQPITVIEDALNEKLMDRYGIKKEYDYVKNSILTTYLSKDNNSKTILLSYHYRCSKKIVSFVNQRYYDNALKLRNLNPGIVKYLDVKNTSIQGMKNAYDEEAKQIARVIVQNNYKDVGIITPFNNQANLINRYLEQYKITDCHADTIHSLQGSEKKVIIMSSALSTRTARRTMDWVKDNHELINVGVTRAKEMFIFVGDKTAIDLLSHGESNDIKALSDYIYSNGEIIVPKSDKIFVTNFSNNSESEKLFFDTIQPYFARRHTKFKILDHVKVKDAIPTINKDELKVFGNKEFDFIIKSTGVFAGLHTVVVFEVDGGEHVGSKATAKRDRIKEEICKKHHITLIRIANSQVKDYQLIISLFESIVKDKNGFETSQSINLLEESY